MESSLGQLGINFQSMALYLVNFGVLFFVIKHFLGKKILSILDERRDRIAESLTAAETLQTEVAEEKAKLANEIKSLRENMAQENAALRQSLNEERAKVMAEVETYRSQALATAEKEAEQIRARLFASMQTEVRAVVGEMIFRILGERANTLDKLQVEDVAEQIRK